VASALGVGTTGVVSVRVGTTGVVGDGASAIVCAPGAPGAPGASGATGATRATRATCAAVSLTGEVSVVLVTAVPRAAGPRWTADAADTT
jgi:hypothetical protein